MTRLWKVLKPMLLIALVLLVVGVLALGVGYKMLVIDEPGEHLQKEHIQELIAQESPVLYSDGETPIGVFFAEEHRIYVEYEDIPECWVDAITSAEDQRFFEHGGVDWVGFGRAMSQNIKAGRVVSGGSTLTMQTSENLFHPGTRDVHGKMYEVLDSYRLEAHYEKTDILEFYANQFHVHGNGRGLGIAARYFFDKDIHEEELTLQECAFLAGMVKGPGNYNPFLAQTPEARDAKELRALKRANYVLERMHIDGKITQEQLDANFDAEMQFSEGAFRYDSSVLLDEVARHLELAPFPEILAAAGIENPATSGLQVVTTLHEPAQRSATYGLWHHLSAAGPALEGASAKSFISDGPAPTVDADAPLVHSFRHARITGRDETGLNLDLGGGVQGRLDGQAIQRAADILAVANGSKNSKSDKASRAALRDALKDDAVVWVSVRSDGQPMICDLEFRPELQGAVVVLEDGRVRAMVGGSDNRNFNRAVAAKRQLGSTWKVLVFNAALQLGWTPTDVLDNRRGVFPFTGTWYYPRPDHKSEDFVSLNWAGVRSENLASIWLLYHLTDRLNDEQVRRLSELTGLSQRKGESRQDYIARIRDQHGVVATRARLPESYFHAVKEDVISGLSFTGNPQDAIEVRSLHYGRGFSDEAARVKGDAIKLANTQQNFLYLEERQLGCEQQLDALLALQAPIKSDVSPRRKMLESLGVTFGQEKATPEPREIDPADFDLLTVRLSAGGFDLACGEEPPSAAYRPVSDDLVYRLGNPRLPKLRKDVLVEGRLHSSTLTSIRGAMDRMAEERADLDPYDAEQLMIHPDFRLILGMHYIADLAEAYGVREELPPVLSMPLGALDISLLEAAQVYQGYLSGQAWSFPGSGFEDSAVPGLRSDFDVPVQGAPALLIQEIRDRDGNVIYRAEPEATQVADPVAGRLTVDILRNVVTHGTGRRAARIAGDFPLGGKTGTTNDFKNAAFIGHAPIADEKGRLDPTHAYTVATYVGYDDNRQMVRGNIKLAGSSGALPAWMGTVEGLKSEGLMGKVSFQEELESGYSYVPVVDYSGLAGGDPEEGRTVLVYGNAEQVKRRFAPLADRAQDQSAPAELPSPEWTESPWEVPGVEPRISPKDPPSVWDGIQ